MNFTFPVREKYDLSLLLLPFDLPEQDLRCVPAGALDGAGGEGVGQVRVAQRLEIAAAAAGLAEVEIVLPGRVPVLGVLLLELHRAHRRERVVDVVERVEVDVQLVIPVAAARKERVVLIAPPRHVPSISSPPLFGHFAVWVRKIRHLKNRTNKRENRRKSYDFHRFLELVAGLEPATC